MLEVSEKKTAELAKLKYERDQARKNLRKGRFDYQNYVESDLAIAFKAGTLQSQVTSAEEAYGYRKQTGVAALINLPEDEEEE